MRPVGLLLLLSLTLAACASPRAYRAEAGVPEVHRFDARGLSLELALKVKGGDSAARIRGVDWEVLLGDLPVGLGTSGVEAVVPPRGETALVLPLALPAGAELPVGVRPALARGRAVPVTVRGVVRLRDRDGDAVRLPFSATASARAERGTVPASALDGADAR